MNHPIRSGAFTRRRFIALTGTAVLAGVVGVPAAHADQKLLDEAMAKVLAGRTAGDGSDIIKLELPEIKTKLDYKVDQRLRKHDLRNVKVVCGDAREILKRAEPAGSVEQVSLHFPDPCASRSTAR